ncbi:uncharacterized protein LOC122193587, partial [Lagopus leucura]|uniref:uncharacterized protein LOC122193587 n=1 Tax=Lagopus leucura TaxID=30410 RepID=UPI001C6680B9
MSQVCKAWLSVVITMEPQKRYPDRRSLCHLDFLPMTQAVEVSIPSIHETPAQDWKKSLMSVPRETYTALALPGRCGNWKFWGVLKHALSAFARGRTEQSDKKQLRVQGIVYLVLISCQFQLVVPAVMGVACSEISCGPDMTRMEAENNGKPLLVREESSLNIPAIGAAHVIKRYVAQAPGELSLEVGDLVCVIDMPPQELSPRWRGKHGFQ